MKGIIVLALKEMVIKKFGDKVWKNVLVEEGVDQEPMIIATMDFEDEFIFKVINRLCLDLNLSLLEIADKFGDYWVNVYSQKIYPHFYHGSKTTKEFLSKVDELHDEIVSDIPNANPPKFELTWERENVLIMKYISKRKMIDFVVGLIKGLGKFYNERLIVTKLDSEKIKVIFF